MGIRNAEKKRTSTCAFADRIATAAITKYQQVVPSGLFFDQQTVMAAFVAYDKANDALSVVAVGAGTKFMPQSAIEADPNGECIHDGHAEVLARRALMRALYLQMHELRTANRGSCLLEVTSQTTSLLLPAAPLASCPYALFRWNPMIGLHFYTSAQPCGNASVKRWAKGKSEQWHNLPPDQLPHLPHERITLHARKEGQAMFLVKRSRPGAAQLGDTSSAVGLPDSTTTSSGMTEAGSCQLRQRSMQQASAKHIPPACAEALTGNGNTASCSDKIARWNVLGVQGGLMLNLLCEPVYSESITIGHKFSRPHATRALCCRLQDFDHMYTQALTSGSLDVAKDLPWRSIVPWNHSHIEHSSSLAGPTTMASTPAAKKFFLHHPVVMCTSIVFDKGIFRTDAAQQAVFNDDRCMSWCQGGGNAELINGQSGRCEGDGMSAYSRASMLEMYCALTQHGDVDHTSSLHQAGHVQYDTLRGQWIPYNYARTALNEVFRSLQP